MKRQGAKKKGGGKRPARVLSSVSIVIVNHNGKAFLGTCLDSLYRLRNCHRQIEIIVIDNCSTDDSQELVREEYPGVKLIENDVNNYCKANNLGIGEGQGEFIVLLNNDVQLEPDWLLEILSVMTMDRKR